MNDEKSLVDINRENKELERLILEIEARKQQAQVFAFTHIILPTVLITLAAGKLLSVFSS